MTQADDELAVQYGMEAKHANRLREFCQGAFKRKKLLIVVRRSNPASLQWHDVPGIDPKPPWVKEKSDAKGLIGHAAQRYFSDYDLQGVYELRDTAPPTYYRFFAGNSVKMDAAQVAKFVKREPSVRLTGAVDIGTVALTEFVRAINAFVCRDGKPMFQHGAQDGFLLSGRPVLDADDGGFLAFEPDGRMQALPTRAELKAFYQRHPGITWAYQG